MNMRSARLFVAFVACCALPAGCADGRAARIAALNHLVGQPEQTLLLSMGVPTRSYETEGVKIPCL